MSMNRRTVVKAIAASGAPSGLGALNAARCNGSMEQISI